VYTACDHPGSDFSERQTNVSLKEVAQMCLNTPGCAAINSDGWIKYSASITTIFDRDFCFYERLYNPRELTAMALGYGCMAWRLLRPPGQWCPSVVIAGVAGPACEQVDGYVALRGVVSDNAIAGTCATSGQTLQQMAAECDASPTLCKSFDPLFRYPEPRGPMHVHRGRHL
jgi:hypothetical protein